MDTPQKTAGHIDGARDAQHAGENGSENMQAIRENETEVESGELEESPESGVQRREAVPEMTVKSVLTGEEHTIEEFLDVVDTFLDEGLQNDRRIEDEVDGIEEEIGELRDEIEELRNGMNRMLGYIQVLAQETGSDQITEDMLEEGFV